MDALDFNAGSTKLTAASAALSALRNQIFRRWTDHVALDIAGAAGLGEKVITNALQKFFDEIINALNQGRSPSTDATWSSILSFHGRDRGSSTAYAPRDLLQELQLFRQSIFEVAYTCGLRLSREDRAIISGTIDAAFLDAITGFTFAHLEIGEIFIACVAHDLRNPLNVANMSAQLIQKKSSDDNVVRLARNVCAKIVVVDEMIGTLLDAMALNGRKKIRLKVTSFDMKILMEEIATEMSSQENPIVSGGESVLGFWCRSSMKRVIENILSNAQKYGKPGSVIEIHTQQASDKIILSFRNEGAVIPEQ